MPMTQLSVTSEMPAWLLRLPEVFEPVAEPVFTALGMHLVRRLGIDYHLVRGVFDPHAQAAHFVGWRMPVDHAWPCQPVRIDGFIEKAAQALKKKFAAAAPQTVLVGAINPSAGHYRSLAINLRGRLLQVMPVQTLDEVENQDPAAETLFCLVGQEGLFAGLAAPRDCLGFYPGGRFFVAKEGAISRAGAKIAEALHHLQLYRRLPRKGSRWVELGACPGGMTEELLRRRYEVTAVDVAPLDERLRSESGLTFVRARVEDFHPHPDAKFEAILCDMNGPPAEAMAQVLRLAPHLRGKGLVVFTLKVPRIEDIKAPLALMEQIADQAHAGNLRVFACAHLPSNGHEWTLFLEQKR